MGENTRVGDILPKTEALKAQPKCKKVTQAQTKMVDEEMILKLLDSKKVWIFHYAVSKTDSDKTFT